jgi:hypothetical protein
VAPLTLTPLPQAEASWGGTEGSSPADLMDRVRVEPRVGRQSGKEIEELIVRMENRSWAMTGIVGAFSQSGSPGFGSNDRQCSPAPRHTAGAGAQADDHLG